MKKKKKKKKGSEQTRKRNCINGRVCAGSCSNFRYTGTTIDQCTLAVECSKKMGNGNHFIAEWRTKCSSGDNKNHQHNVERRRSCERVNTCKNVAKEMARENCLEEGRSVPSCVAESEVAYNAAECLAAGRSSDECSSQDVEDKWEKSVCVVGDDNFGGWALGGPGEELAAEQEGTLLNQLEMGQSSNATAPFSRVDDVFSLLQTSARNDASVASVVAATLMSDQQSSTGGWACW